MSDLIKRLSVEGNMVGSPTDDLIEEAIDRISELEARQIPEGWNIQRKGDEMAIKNTEGLDLLLYRVDGPSSYPSNVLFDLCDAMATAGEK